MVAWLTLMIPLLTEKARGGLNSIWSIRVTAGRSTGLLLEYPLPVRMVNRCVGKPFSKDVLHCFNTCRSAALASAVDQPWKSKTVVSLDILLLLAKWDNTPE